MTPDDLVQLLAQTGRDYGPDAARQLADLLADAEVNAASLVANLAQPPRAAVAHDALIACQLLAAAVDTDAADPTGEAGTLLRFAATRYACAATAAAAAG